MNSMFDFAMVPELADDVAIAPHLPDFESLNLTGCQSLKKHHFLSMVTESAEPIVTGTHAGIPGLDLPGDLTDLAPTAAGEATFDIRRLSGVDSDVDEVLSMLGSDEDDDGEPASLAVPTSHRAGGAASRSRSPSPARKSASPKKGPPKSPTRGSKTRKASKAKAKSPLPADHQPARGRGRAAQLASMTKAQIAAESAIRAEKNRQAARECRLRRKDHVSNLKAKAVGLETRYSAAMKTIKQLQARVAELEQRQAL